MDTTRRWKRFLRRVIPTQVNGRQSPLVATGEQAHWAFETPLADTPNIDVDKIGVRIVAYAAAV